MEENHVHGAAFVDPTHLSPTVLFCEQHGWSGVTEGICYGSGSCKDAAICVLASNFAGRHNK
jgi:hypothetical protein